MAELGGSPAWRGAMGYAASDGDIYTAGSRRLSSKHWGRLRAARHRGDDRHLADAFSLGIWPVKPEGTVDQSSAAAFFRLAATQDEAPDLSATERLFVRVQSVPQSCPQRLDYEVALIRDRQRRSPCSFRLRLLPTWGRHPPFRNLVPATQTLSIWREDRRTNL
jgi:hypothetical protein